MYVLSLFSYNSRLWKSNHAESYCTNEKKYNSTHGTSIIRTPWDINVLIKEVSLIKRIYTEQFGMSTYA